MSAERFEPDSIKIQNEVKNNKPTGVTMHAFELAKELLPFFNSFLLMILVRNSTFMRGIYVKVYPQHVKKKKPKKVAATNE